MKLNIFESNKYFFIEILDLNWKQISKYFTSTEILSLLLTRNKEILKLLKKNVLNLNIDMVDPIWRSMNWLENFSQLNHLHVQSIDSSILKRLYNLNKLKTISLISACPLESNYLCFSNLETLHLNCAGIDLFENLPKSLKNLKIKPLNLKFSIQAINNQKLSLLFLESLIMPNWDFPIDLIKNLKPTLLKLEFYSSSFDCESKFSVLSRFSKLEKLKILSPFSRFPVNFINPISGLSSICLPNFTLKLDGLIFSILKTLQMTLSVPFKDLPNTINKLKLKSFQLNITKNNIESLPRTLTYLEWTNSEFEGILFQDLPPSLTHLKLSKCKNIDLNHIILLPKFLNYLNLKIFTCESSPFSSDSLKNLPTFLETLNLSIENTSLINNNEQKEFYISRIIFESLPQTISSLFFKCNGFPFLQWIGLYTSPVLKEFCYVDNSNPKLIIHILRSILLDMQGLDKFDQVKDFVTQFRQKNSENNEFSHPYIKLMVYVTNCSFDLVSTEKDQFKVVIDNFFMVFLIFQRIC